MVWWVAMAGGAGAVARYLVHAAVQSRAEGRFPFGTVVVNVTGSFLLGLIAGLVIYHGVDADVRTVAGTGFLGGYTTFSAYSYETVGLFEDGQPRAALVNAFGSVVVGLAAAALGLTLASLG